MQRCYVTSLNRKSSMHLTCKPSTKGLLYPLIFCIHSNFQFKIHRTRNSRTDNLNFKEGHLNSRTLQGQTHFQGVFKKNQKFKEYSRTVGTLPILIFWCLFQIYGQLIESTDSSPRSPSSFPWYTAARNK